MSTHIEAPSLNIKNKTFILYNYNIQNFLRCISLLFFNFKLPWVPHLARAPRCQLSHLRLWRQPLPKIKYGKSGDRIENASRKGLRWLSSESGSPEKIRPSIGMYRFLRWYRKCCCLSIFDASSAFSVLFLAKFCTSWYFRIFELNQVQMISHGVPHQLAFYSHPVITGNPLLSLLTEIR